MKAVLVGIERIDYVSKKSGQQVSGLSLHLERDPLPNESTKFASGSLVVFTEYVPDASLAIVTMLRAVTLPMAVELEYVPNGRYLSLVDVKPIA